MLSQHDSHNGFELVPDSGTGITASAKLQIEIVGIGVNMAKKKNKLC